MLHKRRAAAERILHQVRETEQLAARTMTMMAELTAQTATLNATILSARTEADLPVLLGQDALDSGASAYAMMTQGMHHVVETHRRLNEARKQAGLRVVSFGDGHECPPPKQEFAPEPTVALTAVA